MFPRICLIHYHEIGLKGHNRSSFEHRLVKNLQSLLEGRPVSHVRRISGRVLIEMNEEAGFDDLLSIAGLLAGVPGVARVSCGYRCERDLDQMYQAAIDAVNDAGEFQSFKVAARRNHTDFEIDSMQMNQLIGARLCDEFPDKTVKMKDPDLKVCVEVVQSRTYVYAYSIVGVGGLPVGTSGKAVCLLSSGIDSPVATWRIARRGAVCIGLHFSGRPQTSDTSEYLVDEIAKTLEGTGCIARVYVVAFGDYQREIAAVVPPALRVIMYRRLMFKVAEEIARIEKAGAIVTGESLGQVASQTLDNIGVVDRAVDLPVFRPLIGTDKLEIISESQKLGTFETSSKDAPDCCTLFMPRSPETHAKLDDVLKAESALDFDAWIPEIIENIEVTDYRCAAYRPPKRKKQP